jgi:hypothetical protein
MNFSTKPHKKGRRQNYLRPFHIGNQRIECSQIMGPNGGEYANMSQVFAMEGCFSPCLSLPEVIQTEVVDAGDLKLACLFR